MIKEIIEKDLITFEYPPDGGKISIIDPYDGCTIKCPYCFQMTDSNWNKDIIVKLNMPELIKNNLNNWSRKETIYMGSRCDPYHEIERKYELTRNCLIELNKLNIPIMITTKADYGIILRDMDIIKNYSSNITILLGLSNLTQILNTNKNEVIENINLANYLCNQKIKIWTFITPVLPGITDVDEIIDNLNNTIPVFLDKLRIQKDSVQMRKMLSFIQANYPKLYGEYENLINNDTNKYIDELRDKYKDNTRIKFVFD